MRSPCCFLLSAASLVPQQGTKTTCFTQLSLPQGVVRQFGSVKTLIHWARWFKAFGGHKSAHMDWNCFVILSWYLAAQVAPLKVAETKIECYFMSPSFVTLWKTDFWGTEKCFKAQSTIFALYCKSCFLPGHLYWWYADNWHVFLAKHTSLHHITSNPQCPSQIWK